MLLNLFYTSLGVADSNQQDNIHHSLNAHGQDWEIRDELHRVGLNPDYWLPVFSKQLGVTSKLALKSIGQESLLGLEQFACTVKDKASLCKLFSIEDEDSLQLHRKNQKGQLKKRQEKASELLSELKKLQSKGKPYDGPVVQKFENGIREMLQVSQSSRTLSKSDEELDKFISNFLPFLEHVNQMLNDEEYSESSLLTTASEGLALKGVLLSRDLNDQLCDRDMLLHAPEHVQLRCSSHPPDERIEQFSCEHQRTMYKEAACKLGYSSTCTAPTRTGVLGFSCGAAYCEPQMPPTLEDEKSYCSTLKYFSMPLASYVFPDSELMLSKEALDKLIEIDNTINDTSDDSKLHLHGLCETFFKRFGSHVTKGPLMFGGMYWCECSCQGFEQSCIDEVKRIQNDTINNFGISFDVESAYKSVGDNSICFSMNQNESCKPSIKVSSLAEWKNVLLACNTTWRIIDRGTTLVPVWEIIENNHKCDFQNAEGLTLLLCEAWKAMGKLCNEHQQKDKIHVVKGVIEKVKMWNSNPVGFEHDENLGYLLDMKYDLVKEFLDLHVWYSLYLSQVPIQQYLKVVLESSEAVTSNSHIKMSLRQVVERLDLNLMPDFEQKCYISKLLYGTDLDHFQGGTLLPLESIDIELFINFLKQVNHYASAAQAKGRYESTPTHVRIRMTTALSQAFNSLLCVLSKTQQKFESLFVSTVIYPFVHCPKHMILTLLSKFDIQFLHEMFLKQCEQFYILKKMRPMNIQAYLFKLTIEIYCSGEEQNISVSKDQAIRHVIHIRDMIGDELEPQLAAIVNSHYIDNSFKLEDLLLDLERLLEAEEKHSKRVNMLFSDLNLVDGRYNPQQLTLAHALTIREETLGNSKCTQLNQLPFFILQYLMSYDRRCRANILYSSSDDCLLLEEDYSEETQSGEDHNMVHPMDALLALLHCADDFLLQDLVTRLAICQFAIPFILPDPFAHKLTFPIWSMKSIVKEWKCTTDGKTVAKEFPIVNYQTPIISFLRLGKHSKSKSLILNNVIGSDDYFFHRDSDMGELEPVLVDGLVELCWYLPVGKSDQDMFSDAITFLNLHGDACHHIKQTKFLSQISFMSFVLLAEKELQQEEVEVLQALSSQPGGVVLLFCESTTQTNTPNENLDSFKIKEHFCRLKGKNPPAIKKWVRARIKKSLRDKWADAAKEMKKLSECTDTARRNGVVVDEDKKCLTEGLGLVQDIEQLINQNSKDEMLQLQSGNLWIKWAGLDKEEHRQINRGSQTIEEYNSRIQMEKIDVREQQITCAKKLTPVMNLFTNLITSSKYDDDVRKYFLQCLKLHLNHLAQQTIGPLRRDYLAKKRQLSRFHDSCEKDKNLIEQCEKSIGELDKKIVNASFGLEHLLRELGQMYEASEQSDEEGIHDKFSVLPMSAANLLIDGYSLELMDGDAAHVPIEWVTAVLEQVNKTLNDPRVFVLSILGLQSTGKSTLMNTTFGLQFNVSPGRCTRGAFMQLVPIDEALTVKAQCEYVLVIDTEGLRAPEMTSHDSQRHDNELATFVIGLANMTIINLFGESPGDMNDILQTAVHAFLRMKSVKLNQSCKFVHQNVGSLMASSKGERGRLMFKEKLDEMTSVAAKEENCDRRYKCFSDVIRYDDQSDVHYFPSLWNGDPPMAAVNPGYSEKAQNLKLQFVEALQNSENSQPLSAFTTKLKSLWNALLHENFVFSFKNTLEVTIYSELDSKYGEWAWAFEQKMLCWEQKTHTEIKNIKKFEASIVEKIVTSDLPQFVSEAEIKFEEDMGQFFQSHKHHDLIIQWKAETSRRLSNLAETLRHNAEKHCRHLITSQQAIAEVADMKNTYRARLQQHVKRLVSLLSPKEHLSTEALRSKFDEEWTKWKLTLPRTTSIEQETNIELSIQSILETCFTADKNLIIKKLKEKKLLEWGNELKLTVKKETHVGLTERHWLYDRIKVFGIWTDRHRKKSQMIIDDILREVEEYLRNESIERFSGVYIHKLVKDIIVKSLDSFMQSENNDFDIVFKQECKIDLSLTACGYALKWFQTLENEFKKQTDPIEYLEREMREPYFIMFENLYFQIAGEKAAASTFCELLCESVKRHVINSLSREVVSDMMVNCKYLHSKSVLKAKVLLDIGESLSTHDDDDGALDNMFTYILDTKHSLRNWIEHYTKTHCETCGHDGEPRFVYLAKKQLSQIISFLTDKAQVITDTCLKEEKYGEKEMLSIKVWVHLFGNDKELKSTLELDAIETFEHLGDIEEANLENFTEEVQRELLKLQNRLAMQFETEMSAVALMNSLKLKPSTIIYDRLRGCCEQCPFCKEQCDYTDPGHAAKHMVHQHRPQCLASWVFAPTEEICLDLCNYNVGSTTNFTNKDATCHPFSEYQKIYPRWSIPVDLTASASTYWKWFVGHYHAEIAKHYSAKTTSIPRAWTVLKWEDAKKELQKLYGV